MRRVGVTETRWRAALLEALLPPVDGGLPPISSVDLEAFFGRFDRAAPPHLALGFRAATALVGGLLPRILGQGASLADLDDDARDAVVRRAASLPLFGDLLEVAKVVACLAYFQDAAVQEHARGRS